MRLFNNLSPAPVMKSRSIKEDKGIGGVVVENTGISEGRRGRRLIKRTGPSNQPSVSKAEIRQKYNTSTKAAEKKQAALRKATRESSTFMNEKKAVGDVGFNDPNSAVTVGKLKDLVSGGGFAFSDKERNVLAEILKDR